MREEQAAAVSLLECSDEECPILSLRVAQGLEKIETHRDAARGIGAPALPLRPVADKPASPVPPNFADVRIRQQEAQRHVIGELPSKPRDPSRRTVPKPVP
jgi:hypothetical protein